MTATDTTTMPLKTIDGEAKTIKQVLFGSKFHVDYYQREYRWDTEQLEELINDLTGLFLRNYSPEHIRREVAGYDHYFLGSIIISEKKGMRFIIDGQQRLTTLTLLLLYLMKRQQAAGVTSGGLSELIYSDQYGEHSFNLDVPDRRDIMLALFKGTTPEEESLTESCRNIAARYDEIGDFFPEQIDDKALPYFVDWLTQNVHLVEITTYSDEVAYTIFETMNDRGLSLSRTDMLKGYLLANIKDEADRNRAGTTWKSIIAKLQAADPSVQEPDADFFKAWFRAQYADSSRPRKKDAEPEAWEHIIEYHRWVRDETERLKLAHNGVPQPAAYRDFILNDMAFYAKWYLFIRDAERKPAPGLENIYHNASHRFTHQPTLLLAALAPTDNEQMIRLKLRLVAKYADIYLARRLCNYRGIDYNVLQYYVHLVVRAVRGLEPAALAETLTRLLVEQEQQKDERGSLAGFDTFALNQWSHKPIKRLLARMIDYVEIGSGGTARYHEMMTSRGKKAYEIEHIWASNLEPAKHTLGLEPGEDFHDWRNRLGGLLLLPKSFNASFCDNAYADKVEHYYGRDAQLIKSLHPNAYENNPGFKRFIHEQQLPFRAHAEFKKADIDERQKLYRALADRIWDPAWIGRILGGEEPVA